MIKISIFLICFLTAIVINAQQVPKHLNELYNKIYASMSNGSIIKPTLKLIDDYSDGQSYKEVATYSPVNRTITIGTSFLHLTSKFGIDSNNARAHVLSHELAHLFLNHGFASVIGTGFASVEINKELKKHKESLEDKMSELEADQWAHFYAYIGGFQTNHVAPNLLDSIYKYYHLTDKLLSNYPKLTERKKFANDAGVKMKSMCEVFDFANIACIHENYEMSIELYNAIIQEGFKSREIVSNLGTAYVLNAIKLMDTSETKFILPLQIDMETRMRQINKRGGLNDENINELLNRSIELFKQSISMDSNYGTAYLNLGIAYWLHKESKDSEYYLEKAKEKADTKLQEKIKLFEAVKLYHSVDSQKKADGLRLLKSLEKQGNLLAKANLNLQSSNKANTSKAQEWVLNLSKVSLPTNFQSSTNILDSTFKKDRYHTLSCKEVDGEIKYRKWRSLKEQTYIVNQYIFKNEINKVFSASEKLDLIASSQAVFETSNALYLLNNDVILIIDNNERIRYQIIKNN